MPKTLFSTGRGAAAAGEVAREAPVQDRGLAVRVRERDLQRAQPGAAAVLVAAGLVALAARRL